MKYIKYIKYVKYVKYVKYIKYIKYITYITYIKYIKYIMLEVRGVSPTGKSFRFVRACERAGEARRSCVGEREAIRL